MKIELLRLCRIIAAGPFILGLVNVARGDADSTTPKAPPAYTVLRYDEDYSYLKDPDARTDFFDPAKYLPFNEQGDAYLSLGGQVRDRYEYFHNNTFGSGAQDQNGYNLLRVMLNADVHAGPFLRAFVQGISATEQDRVGGPRSSDENKVDLHQAFVDLTIPLGDDLSFNLRSGRQVVIFGAQRLIGASDWTNVRRTTDGFRATLNSPGNSLDAFYLRPARVLPYTGDDNSPHTFLLGLYDTWKIPGELSKAKTQLESYVIYANRQNMTFNKTKAGESRYTFGSRVTAIPKPFDIDVEGDYQVGQFHEKETHSFSLAAVGGFTFEHVLLSPRPFIGFDIASGGRTDNPGDAFDQLFPSGHDQFGIIDALGRQNIIDVHPGVTLALLKNEPAAKAVSLLAQYRQFWRESNQDAAYTSSGTVLRASGISTATSIGGEFDLQLNWQFDRHISAYAGYCHFFEGAFISNTGPHHDIDFAFSALTFMF